MKVGLFAPHISFAGGGVWQFYQLVVRHVGQSVSFVLVAPSAALAEVCERATCTVAGIIPFEPFAEGVKAGAAYRILEGRQYSRIGGIRILGYGTVARKIRQMFFSDNIIGHALHSRLRRDGVEVLHIPVQQVPYPRAVGRLPYVINPHDFQHEHFPQFFSAEALKRRRSVWYEGQRKAAAVVIHSRQTQADAIRYLRIPEERVFYAPYGPLDTFSEPDEAGLRKTIESFSLPERFVFYPARMWPHKNHLALVEAIYRLRQRGVEVNAVFTDATERHGQEIRERISAAGLERQVFIVGRITPEQMGALYRQCTLVVIPSLFEQNSGPMLEAIHFGKAVAVSRIAEMVESLDGAGILFDPHSVSEIADAIDHIWSSDSARTEAEAEIRIRRARMSWEPFKRAYEEAYAFAAQRGAPAAN